MKKIICGVGGFFLYALLVSSLILETLGEAEEECHPRNESYNVADTQQCDMYHECSKNGKGEMVERLCDDGFVYSREIQACDYPHNVNCSDRPILQPSKSTVKECERLNGLYAFPPEESCQKFYHCLEGKAYEKTCPDGVIYDPSLGSCIHPDLSHRKDCAARAVLNFTCPNFGKKFVRLRFGDHERLPHPTNCRKFFICLSDGKPRVGGCPLGKVFNPKRGMCDSPKKVPQCKDYYGNKDLAKLAKLAELGEEGSLALLEDGEEGEHTESTLDEEVPTEEDHPKAKTAATKKKTFTRRESPFNAAESASPAQPQANSSSSPVTNASQKGQPSPSESSATNNDDDKDSDDEDPEDND